MNKTPRILLLAVALASVALPALADTSFSFVSVDYGFDGRPRGRPYGHHHRHHRPPPPPFAPVFYAPAPPVYVSPPPRTIVYETTVVRPVTRVVDYGMPADQISETYRDPHGRLCREYLSAGTVGGSRQQMYGTACQQLDGSWRVVN